MICCQLFERLLWTLKTKWTHHFSTAGQKLKWGKTKRKTLFYSALKRASFFWRVVRSPPIYHLRYTADDTRPIATILGRGLLLFRSSDPLSYITLSSCLLARSYDKSKTYFASTMARKLDRVVTYNEELPPLMSHNSSSTRSCKVTWQIKCLMYSLALDQWSPNMGR